MSYRTIKAGETIASDPVDLRAFYDLREEYVVGVAPLSNVRVGEYARGERGREVDLKCGTIRVQVSP